MRVLEKLTLVGLGLNTVQGTSDQEFLKGTSQSDTEAEVMEDWGWLYDSVNTDTSVEEPYCQHSIQRIKNGPSFLASQILGTGKPFEDPDFPITEVITYPGKEAIYTVELQEYTNAWIRAGEIPDATMWSNEETVPSPRDIVQGYIGDCYLVSSLSALADLPGRVERIVKMHEINEEGIYTFKMWALGLPIEVSIDDRLPFYV